MCFTVDTLLPYAEYLDSMRQSSACTLVSEPLGITYYLMVFISQVIELHTV